MSPPPDQNLIIRPMTLDDIDEVYQIEKISFSLPWSRRSYQFEVCDNKSSRSYVAEAILIDGSRRIAGMSVLWLILDEAHIANLAIHPSFRGLGIGKKLLATSILNVYNEGARQFFLEVRRGNLTAQRIYTEFGFKVEGVRKNYYKDTGEDALLMALNNINQPFLARYANAGIAASSLIHNHNSEVENGS